MSIESVMPSNHLILCHPLLFLPSIFPSIRVFSKESALRIRWPKYWSFSFNISPSKEHPRLILFRMDWLDLLVIQGPLRSLLQQLSSKHQFFSVQLYLECISHIHTSVQFSHSVGDDSLRPHKSQHARPPCPSPTHGVQTHVH